MLGITATIQAASSSNLGFCSYGTLDSSSSSSANNATAIGFGSSAGMMLDDDMMDPLFDEDWLHENNLDKLFDLFEEEIESKCVESNNGSSTLFSTSPVTSYLFGTSPSLASALDLLCFDQQQQPNSTAPQQQQNFNIATNSNSPDATNNQLQQQQQIANVVPIKVEPKETNSNALITCNNIGGMQQVHHQTATTNANANYNNQNASKSSITQAMRIKRGLKKGHSEGVSLLAKPLSASNNGKININNSSNINNNNIISCSSSSNNNNNNSSNTIARTIKFNAINGSSSNGSGNKIIVNKNNSDKTSTRITNFKNSILGKNDNNKVTNGVEINYSKQGQNYRYLKHNCQQHVHYITGRAVIREHAYAVRGH